MKRFFILLLSTGFGLGYSPFAPGTVGSIPGFLLLFFFIQFNSFIQLIFIVVSFFIGVLISNLSIKYFDNKDPRQVTIDEIVSIPITFFMIPLTMKTIILGFVLNRVLDIIKPYPAFSSQKLPKGWGIMTDDIISSFYSNIILRIIILSGLINFS